MSAKETYPPVPSLERQILTPLRALPHLSREEEQQLVEHARRGDHEAREMILLLCQRSIAGFARQYYWLKDRGLEYVDLIQQGTLTMVEGLPTALSRENTFAYLIKAGCQAIRFHCMAHDSLITHAYDKPRLSISSLDAPLSKESQVTLAECIPLPEIRPPRRREHTELYRAIRRLTRRQRLVISRYYGLGGRIPQPLQAAGKDLGFRRGKEQDYAWQAKFKGLRSLRRHLAEER